MIDPKVLLREKLRYSLPLEVSKKELKLLAKDYPVQRIIGYCEMQNVRIFLNRYTLIPRYETEEVILKAYEYLDKNSSVLDLGTGSGFIGLAIKKNIGCKVTMIDKSIGALKMAKKNAVYNNLDVEIFQSSWFSKVKGTFDVIIANPPYLNKQNIEPNKRPKFDPEFALYSEDSGLSDYKKILKNAFKYLKSNGIIIFEIDDFAAPWFVKNYSRVEIFKDINNKNRIAVLKAN